MTDTPYFFRRNRDVGTISVQEIHSVRLTIRAGQVCDLGAFLDAESSLVGLFCSLGEERIHVRRLRAHPHTMITRAPPPHFPRACRSAPLRVSRNVISHRREMEPRWSERACVPPLLADGAVGIWERGDTSMSVVGGLANAQADVKPCVGVHDTHTGVVASSASVLPST